MYEHYMFLTKASLAVLRIVFSLFKLLAAVIGTMCQAERYPPLTYEIKPDPVN